MARFKKCNWQSSQLARRLNAETKTEERTKRSPEQQLTLIAERPGKSLRETLRLQKAIKERDHAPQIRKAEARKDKKQRRQEGQK